MSIALIITLSILYLLGSFVTLIILSIDNLSGTSIAPDYYGPFSKWFFTTKMKGGFLGNLVMILGLALWPIVLPLYVLKK